MDWYDATEEFHRRTFEQEGRLSSLAADWERELAALWRLEADVNNGAYLQFLTNWGRESYVYASQGLTRMGAHKMADLIDRCQALVDEHFDCAAKTPAELCALLPNPVIGADGNLTKAAGSLLPDSVLERVFELSHEFMKYPDDLATLGMRAYWHRLAEIERDVDERKKVARTFQEMKLTKLAAALDEAERSHQEKVKNGAACPNCGFSYSWDGTNCGHCHHRAKTP